MLALRSECSRPTSGRCFPKQGSDAVQLFSRPCRSCRDRGCEISNTEDAVVRRSLKTKRIPGSLAPNPSCPVALSSFLQGRPFTAKLGERNYSDKWKRRDPDQWSWSRLPGVGHCTHYLLLSSAPPPFDDLGHGRASPCGGQRPASGSDRHLIVLSVFSSRSSRTARL